MKIRDLLIITVFIFFLLISFLFFMKKEEKAESNICNSFIYPLLRKMCLARINDDLSTCLTFEGKYKEFCASSILNKMYVNYSFCDSLHDETLRKVCFRKLASTTKNTDLCEDDYCFFISKNLSACEKIKVDWLKYTCKAKITENKSVCQKIDDEYERNSCLGLVLLDPSICIDSLCKIYVASATRNIQICKDLFSYSRTLCIAESGKTLEACNSLKDEYERELCTILYWGRPLNEIF